MVRCGGLPEVLGQLVLETGAAEILAEEEVEYRFAWILYRAGILASQWTVWPQKLYCALCYFVMP